MRRVERFYDFHAPGYEGKFQSPAVAKVKRMEEEGILEFLFEHLPAPSEGIRLLELGCGTGLFTLPVAGRGYRVTAVDISEGMLAELRAKAEAQSLANVTLRKADVEEIAAEDGGYDGVFGIGLLEYLQDPARVVAKAAELLRPGGVAAFTGPTVSMNGLCYVLTSLVRKRMRMKLFTRRGLGALFEAAGLDIVEIRPVGFHLPLMSTLTRIAAGRKPQAPRA